MCLKTITYFRRGIIFRPLVFCYYDFLCRSVESASYLTNCIISFTQLSKICIGISCYLGALSFEFKNIIDLLTAETNEAGTVINETTFPLPVKILGRDRKN